jgi:23S rRNA pseudouridine2605 synthase
MIRINRYLAAAGLGSRRGVEKLIAEGRVKINGRVVEGLGALVAAGDTVKVGSKTVSPQEVIHAVLFKPKGVVCTAEDERGRPTIFKLLPDDWPRVYHVGRLDKESEGLLIVTNDGDLSLALTHPRFKVEKEYEVTLDKPFDPAHASKLLKGFHIEGGRARMEEITQLSPVKIRVILTQGIKRQIRLMLYGCGYEVENLRRTRIGTVRILKLRPGMWRMLSAKEISDLKAGRTPEQRPVPRKKAQERSRAGSAQTGKAGQSGGRAPQRTVGRVLASREFAGEAAGTAVAGPSKSARPRRGGADRRGPEDSYPRGLTPKTARSKRGPRYPSRPEGGPPAKRKGRS